MHDRCATCGQTEESGTSLFECACGRTVCPEHAGVKSDPDGEDCCGICAKSAPRADDATGPAAADPAAARSDAADSDAARTDAARTDAARTDAARTDAAASESAGLGAAGAAAPWSEVRTRVWGGVGVALAGLAAYTVLEQNGPKYYLVLIALLALAAVSRMMPARK